MAVTEPDAGSDVKAIRTRARREGGEWVLNGSKMFITNGVHADLYFVAARTDPEAKGARAVSMFIVEKGTAGLRVGRALKKSGWLCSDTAELVFEDCRVPEENLLGGENDGFYAIMKNFQTERIALAAMAVGHALAIDDKSVATLTLNRPDVHNAFDDQLIANLTHKLREPAHNRDVRMVVMAASGKSSREVRLVHSLRFSASCQPSPLTARPTASISSFRRTLRASWQAQHRSPVP